MSECFLENMQVSYGGDRYKTFDPHNNEGAPPVETSITLAFKEIELCTEKKWRWFLMYFVNFQSYRMTLLVIYSLKM